jgi:hypothetical protein
MQVEMTAQEVLEHILELHNSGHPITKRKVKESYPTLFRNALYYYPSWEHAVKECGISIPS